MVLLMMMLIPTFVALGFLVFGGKQFPGTLFAMVLGYPKINLDEYDIVTSQATDDAFRTKKSEPIKLRGN